MLQELAWRPTIAFHQELEVQEEEEARQEVQEASCWGPMDHEARNEPSGPPGPSDAQMRARRFLTNKMATDFAFLCL